MIKTILASGLMLILCINNARGQQHNFSEKQFQTENSKNNLQYDFFKSNDKSIVKKTTAPDGDILYTYCDLYNDLPKSDVPFLTQKITEAIQVFKDSLYDGTAVHTLEIAVTPDQQNTFYRYKSAHTDATDIAVLHGETTRIKHQMDTLRIFEHFYSTASGDSTIYKIEYEFLVKDLTSVSGEELARNFKSAHDSLVNNQLKYFGFKRICSNFGVYFGGGFSSNSVSPIAAAFDYGILYRTGRSRNGYTPFIAYNMRGTLAYNDNFYQGTTTHLLEWGWMRTTYGNVLYKKFSLGIGAMRLGKSPDIHDLYKSGNWIFATTINFPVINNVNFSLDAGTNFKKQGNNNYYVGVTLKYYMSTFGF